MKLATFTEAHRTRIGVVVDDTIVDLAAAAPHLPQTMVPFLRNGAAALDEARTAAERGRHTIPLTKVRLEAPVPRPGKVNAIGLNYADHVREGNRPIPEHQIWFSKQATCIVGPNDAIAIPKVSSKIDWEAELCVVISRRCRHVPRSRANEVIAGYMCGNDVSVRDWQARTPTMMMGKGFDTHGPTGPWIVTPDEAGDVQALGIRSFVNGVAMQNASTKEMIFDIPAQIEHLTAAFTLEPGDVIFTGTPAGVGNFRTPPVFLKAGDIVRIEIDRLGAIENKCEAESGETQIC